MKSILIAIILTFSFQLIAQDHHGHDHDGHDHHGHNHDHHGHNHSDDSHSEADHQQLVFTPDQLSCQMAAPTSHGHHEYDPTATALHHISDGNVYTIMDAIRIPLPMILYSADQGWDFFWSSKFDPGHHDQGHYAYNRYVLYEGNVRRIDCANFPMGKQEINGFTHAMLQVDGKEKDLILASSQSNAYVAEARTTWDGGLLGGGTTSFYDLSITKNVVSILMVCLLLFWMFRSAAKAYSKRQGLAPSGIQSLLEPMVVFIREDIAEPFIGHKYEKYMPLLVVLFFLILGLNLWGQIPFLGGVNATGNITFTAILAIVVFVITNINGNSHYWQHIFWMPGVPIPIRIVLAFVEILGLFIKPLTLMLRLAGNITAGHIAILSFIGLIFILGKSGTSVIGTGMGTLLAIPLTMFMMAIEVIVAFVQAFVFTILAASYIGAAVEEVDH